MAAAKFEPCGMIELLFYNRNKGRSKDKQERECGNKNRNEKFKDEIQEKEEATKG
jgi:hypothetical protein